MPASLPISRQVIEYYCKLREMTLNRLQELSGILDRSFRRIIKTGRAGEFNATRIAAALGISVDELTTGNVPTGIQKRILKNRYNCSVYLDVPLAEMVKATARQEKTALLKHIIRATSPIEPLGSERGSTIWHLSLTDADILRLLAAMMDNELQALRITKVVIPDSSWLLIMLALLNYNNKELIKELRLTPLSANAQPQLIHPEALSLLLANHVLEDDMKMKTKNCLMCKRID